MDTTPLSCAYAKILRYVLCSRAEAPELIYYRYKQAYIYIYVTQYYAMTIGSDYAITIGSRNEIHFIINKYSRTRILKHFNTITQ